MSREFDYSKNLRMICNVKEHLNLLDNFGVTIGSTFQSLINGSDEMQRCESLQLSRICPIVDGPSGFLYVTHFRSDNT